MYLINHSEDYADEFDYPVISLFTTKVRNYLLLHGFGYLEDDAFHGIYFGSNEELSFFIPEVQLMIRDAVEIPEEEIQYAKKYLDPVPCIDLVDYMVDALYYIMSSRSQEEQDLLNEATEP